jgi:hypothetical protein
MPFFIAYADPVTGLQDTGTNTQLSPAPSDVEYPSPQQTRLATAAGTTIVQRPPVDNRVRSWIWQGYPGWFQRYQDLWTVIEPLHARYRLTDGDATPYAYLKEDETKMLRTISVSGHTVTSAYPYFRCRIINVERKLTQGPKGLVVYAETRIDFVIDDPTYNDLG